MIEAVLPEILGQLKVIALSAGVGMALGGLAKV
jgi:hypothetical protein